MLVLALETATAQTGVAIGGSDGAIASFEIVLRWNHVEALAPAIEFVCRQAGAELSTVDCVAVDVGPGLFTGLRVGVAAAKAIAHANGIAVVGVSSLDALAFPARMWSGRIFAVIDALRDEIYYASYAGEPEGVRQLTKPRVAGPEVLAAELRTVDEHCLLVGDGARRYAHVLGGADRVEVAPVDLQFPSARAVAAIGVRKALRGEVVSESALEIEYLREPYIHPKRRLTPAG